MGDGSSRTSEGSDLQNLIRRSQEGDTEAMAELRRATGGKFENEPKSDIPPMYRSAYPDPLSASCKSFGEIRASRKYSMELVDDFVDRICDADFLPPGAAMMLFVFMCTKHEPLVQNFPAAMRIKMMAVFKAWDESHHWVQANVLSNLRHRLFEEHHHVFVRAAFDRARKSDRLVEEAKRLVEEIDGKEEAEEETQK